MFRKLAKEHQAILEYAAEAANTANYGWAMNQYSQDLQKLINEDGVNVYRTDTSIMKVFITYGVIIGAVGAAVGATLGLGICWVVKTFGIGLDPDVYYITNLPVHVDYFEVSLVLVAAVLLSYLATIYPSLIAARMRPVEGLRFE